MDIFMILAAFGGGAFAAAIGALPAFILVGIVGLTGLTVSTGPINMVDGVAFGAFLGPHISFAAGVGAAAFAHKIGELESGADLVTPLNKFSNPLILLVGGAFGVIGCVLNYLFLEIIHVPADTGALTVLTSGVIARLVFGKSGLLGDTKVKERKYFPNSKEIIYLIMLGLGAGLVSSYYAVTTGIAVLGFFISATTLIFAQMGYAVPVTHHITLMAGLAGVTSGNIYIGAAFGIIAAIVGDIVCKTLNSHTDSHIDPPATTNFLLSLIITLLL